MHWRRRRTRRARPGGQGWTVDFRNIVIIMTSNLYLLIGMLGNNFMKVTRELVIHEVRGGCSASAKCTLSHG